MASLLTFLVCAFCFPFKTTLLILRSWIYSMFCFSPRSFYLLHLGLWLTSSKIWLCEVEVKFNFFSYGHPIMSALFIEMTIFSLLNFIGIFVPIKPVTVYVLIILFKEKMPIILDASISLPRVYPLYIFISTQICFAEISLQH